MASFRDQMARATILDTRERIGPHHLAIGKTRKLFEHDGIVHAFYSRGYEIAHTTLDAESLTHLHTHSLSLPVAWGGGAFCVDNAGNQVGLVFAHRNQHELCFVQGKIQSGEIHFGAWQSLGMTTAHQAAPWVELAPDGTAWASVVARDGDYRVAVIAPDGTAKTAPLFHDGEKPWYHSCVQMEPVSATRALAIGFRGTFPGNTELVYRTVERDLSLGPSTTLAPNNVNDKLTFHFQAVGDPERGRAHIVYLDDGLSTSHALYENVTWRVAKSILPVASFAPQIALAPNGDAAMIAADYEGALWRAAWSPAKGWSTPRKIDHAKAPNISPTFSHTGYGTGGLISAARSSTGRVPYLFGTIEDDASAKATLRAAQLGDTGFTGDPLTVRIEGQTIDVELRLGSLRQSDVNSSLRRWLVVIPAGLGRALKIDLQAKGKDIEGRAIWHDRNAAPRPDSAKVTITTELHDAFSHNEAGILRASLKSTETLSGLDAKTAWAEFYAGDFPHPAALTDIAPFEPETAARMTFNPAGVPLAYKRMV